VKTELSITGMTCNGCVRHVEKALRGIPGVTAVEVVLADQRATVVHEPAAEVPALVAAVVEAGYQAVPR
jgi:Cu+-exporting ATPase